ncbi:MAG TPA: 1,2-phenylacetyl-CoA epoxidase subunit PaaC [Herpetosiphonaceae bacterium]|nr:1,2-phenylacetyl-CoA epoxidase subunit PaaC [Herpetosiphonaceae bacterium]
MSAPQLPRAALREILLSLADDDFVTGYTNSEWTGIAPMLEEDLAFSSLAQDELGHARLLYDLLAALESCSADDLAYGREPEGFRHAQLVERPRGDWAYSVSRQFLYDTADYVRLESLTDSSYAPLATGAAAIIREERYHLLHANTWLERLAEGGAEARGRQQAAFDALWPDALGFWEPVQGEDELVAAGILPDSFAELQQQWLDRIEEPITRLRLPFPFVRFGETWQPRVEAVIGGRRGEHGASFVEFHAMFTSVYRLDPRAKW